MKKLVMGIVVAMLISVTAVYAAEEAYDSFSYYDADNDRYVTEYYYHCSGENESFEYYDADNDCYCVEYYIYDNVCGDDADYEAWYPDYSDLYQDEYQAAWYSPAMVYDWADFYSLQGEYICAIPPQSWVQPLESIGRSGDITYIAYDGREGYIYTTLLLNPCGVTYDEIYQAESSVVQLLYDADLLDDSGNYIVTIPAGYGVELVNFDATTNRCWIRWNGRFGSIDVSAIWSDPSCYYADEGCDEGYEDDEVYYGYCEEDYYECFGYAKIIPLQGANVRDGWNSDDDVIIAVPYGYEVMLLEPLNYGGRTLIKWGRYTGTILTSCLKVCSA